MINLQTFFITHQEEADEVIKWGISDNVKRWSVIARYLIGSLDRYSLETIILWHISINKEEQDIPSEREFIIIEKINRKEKLWLY